MFLLCQCYQSLHTANAKCSVIYHLYAVFWGQFSKLVGSSSNAILEMASAVAYNGLRGSSPAPIEGSTLGTDPAPETESVRGGFGRPSEDY